MCRFERIGNLNRHRQQLFDFQNLPAHTLRQRLALEQLHHNKMLPLVLFDRVNRANVWMIQRGCRTRFSLESFQELGVARHFVRQKLYRDFPPEPRILGFIHHTHATAADFAEHFVLGKRLTDRRICLCHRVQILVALPHPVKASPKSPGHLSGTYHPNRRNSDPRQGF